MSELERGESAVDEDELSGAVIGAAIVVHRALGPGLLESAYEQCLAIELGHRGIPVRRQVPVPLIYRGASIDTIYRLDLLVDDRLINELKSVEAILGIHEAQVLTYLKLTGHRIALLMNFNTQLLRDGVRRFVR